MTAYWTPLKNGTMHTEYARVVVNPNRFGAWTPHSSRSVTVKPTIW